MKRYVQQYFITALWSSNDGDEPLDANYDIQNISKETVKQGKKNLKSFIKQAKNAGLLTPYLEVYDMDQLAHDFWLTQNAHGAGFWDRSGIDWELGHELTKLAQTFGEMYLYVGDDGKIYA